MAMILVLLLAVTATMSYADICPGGKERCPGSLSCCPLSSGSGEFGCCPFPKAQCCNDKVHCCPHGQVCDLTHQGCRIHGTDILLKWNVNLHPELIETVEQPLTIITEAVFQDTDDIHFARVIQKVYDATNDVQHKGYTADISENKEFSSKEGHISGTEVVQSQGNTVNGFCHGGRHHWCPLFWTCCKQHPSDYGWCCPHAWATCCDDGHHCCPHGHKCGAGGSCIKDNGETDPWETPLQKPLALAKPIINDEALMEGVIKSKYYASKYVLYKEDQIKYSEQKDVSAKNENVPEVEVVELHGKPVNGFCQGSPVKFCPLFWTCCRDQAGEWGCCPHAWATCCADRIHCCPHGYKCGVSSCERDRNLTLGRQIGYDKFHTKKHYKSKDVLLL